MDRLLVVFLLTAFINLINSLTRSSRLSGVRTGSLATAISSFRGLPGGELCQHPQAPCWLPPWR